MVANKQKLNFKPNQSNETPRDRQREDGESGTRQDVNQSQFLGPCQAYLFEIVRIFAGPKRNVFSR
jgi:hypothetical protein